MGFVVGIDEAGRGAVLGPLVLAGVKTDEAFCDELTKMGVKDSKLFGSSNKSRDRRAKIAEKIHAECTVQIAVFNACDLDIQRTVRTLDAIECNGASRIVYDLHGQDARIIADGQLFKPLGFTFANFEWHTKADSKFAIVAAASIVAKHNRDDLTHKYHPYIKDVGGGGYPNTKTLSALEDYVNDNGELPEGVRHSWTWTRKHFPDLVEPF